MQKESIDTIITVQCLCSIPTPELIIKDLFPLLKPGGQWLVYEHVKTKYQGDFVGYWQSESDSIQVVVASADRVAQRVSISCGRTSSAAAISRGRRMSGSFRLGSGRKWLSTRARRRGVMIRFRMLLGLLRRGGSCDEMH